MYVVTTKSQKSETISTADGGSVTLIQSENGKSFSGKITKGFKETPEERLERISASRRGGAHADKRPNRQGRTAQKRNWKREF